MLEKIYGTISVRTDKINSKTTIPLKANVDGQLKDFLSLVESILKANGDKPLIDNFCNRLKEIM